MSNYNYVQKVCVKFDLNFLLFFQELMTYLEETWIANQMQSIRTNNDIEGWHRRLNDRQLHILVALLYQEVSLLPLQRKLVHVSEGKLCRRERKTGQQQRIFRLWDKYKDKYLRSRWFLFLCGKVIGPIDK